MSWEGGHSNSLSKEEDEQSSLKRRCFGQLHFSPSMCDLFLITPLFGSKLSSLFNFNLINFNSSPRFQCLFLLVHGFRFMQFDPQLINKLLISSIWPLNSVNFSLFIYMTFPVWSLVSDFFNQVSNWPSNFNIYAIKPLIWPNQLLKIYNLTIKL